MAASVRTRSAWARERASAIAASLAATAAGPAFSGGGGAVADVLAEGMRGGGAITVTAGRAGGGGSGSCGDGASFGSSGGGGGGEASSALAGGERSSAAASSSSSPSSSMRICHDPPASAAAQPPPPTSAGAALARLSAATPVGLYPLLIASPVTAGLVARVRPRGGGGQQSAMQHGVTYARSILTRGSFRPQHGESTARVIAVWRSSQVLPAGYIASHLCMHPIEIECHASPSEQVSAHRSREQWLKESVKPAAATFAWSAHEWSRCGGSVCLRYAPPECREVRQERRRCMRGGRIQQVRTRMRARKAMARG